MFSIFTIEGVSEIQLQSITLLITKKNSGVGIFFFILQLNNKIPNRKSFKWNVGLFKVLVASIFQPLNIEELSSKVRFPKRWLLKRLYCTNVSSDLRSIHLLLHCVS